MLRTLILVLVASLMIVPISEPFAQDAGAVHISFANSPEMNISIGGRNTTLSFFNPNFMRFYMNMGVPGLYPHIHWHILAHGKLNYTYSANTSSRLGINGFPGDMRDGIFNTATDYQNITINISKVTKVFELNGTNNTTLMINSTNSLSISYHFSIHDTRNLPGEIIIPMAVYQGKGFGHGIAEKFNEKRMKMELNGLVMPFNNTKHKMTFSLNSRYIYNGQEMNSTLVSYHFYRFYVYFLVIPYSGKYNNISYDPYVTLPSSFPLKTVTVSTPITQAIAEIENNVYAFVGGIVFGTILIGAGYISYRRKRY